MPENPPISPPALEIIILAAGRGTRMRSERPKVLHTLAGKPLLGHVLDGALALEPAAIHVVCGFGSDEIQAAFSASKDINWVFQKEQKGTAHAVQQALPAIDRSSNVLILYGDVPLTGLNVLQSCVEHSKDSQPLMRLVTTVMENPAGLGRIIRDKKDNICAIVEDKDASSEQKKICEINTGILYAPVSRLSAYLDELKTDNVQGELYLTDVIAVAVREGLPVECIIAEKSLELMGVNDRLQLAKLERYFQTREAHRLLELGVALADPERLDVRGSLTAGKDCYIDCNVVIEGEVTLGDRVHIEPGVIIRDSHIGDDVNILANTLIEGSQLDAECSVGPFARIRPGSHLSKGVKVGNFVETKKVFLGENTKASHLSYLGDAHVGANSNIGAGTIFCNYDGVNKHKTEIGDGVFVGSNSTLIAPISIGDGAFLAAGSTLNKNVDGKELAVARGKQRNIKGWKSPVLRGKK